MKMIVTAVGMVFCIAATAMAEGDVKVSGSVEINYRNSSDKYAGKGDDEIKAEELYLKVEKEVAEKISAMIKLDGSDMDEGNQSSTHKYVEEAQVIFKEVAGAPLTLIFGKDEMPFGQDYEKFFLSSATHGFEVDKVWGLHGIYNIEGAGSFAAAAFERAPEYNSATQAYDKPDTELTDSFAVKFKADKMIENLSLELSHARTGKDESDPDEVDEDRTSVGGIYKADDLTLHAEYTAFSDRGHASGADLDVILVGADYMMGSLLLKARYEASDNDVDNDGSEEDRVAAGVSYYFNSNAVVALEWERITYDGGGVSDDDEFLVGAAFKF